MTVVPPGYRLAWSLDDIEIRQGPDDLTAAFNPLQWRDPRTGQWIDMPWTVLRRYFQGIEKIPGVNQVFWQQRAFVSLRNGNAANLHWYENNRELYRLERETLTQKEISFGEVQDALEKAQQVLQEQERWINDLDISVGVGDVEGPVTPEFADQYRRELHVNVGVALGEIDRALESIQFKHSFDVLEQGSRPEDEKAVLGTVRDVVLQELTLEKLQWRLREAGMANLSQNLQDELTALVKSLPDVVKKALTGDAAARNTAWTLGTTLEGMIWEIHGLPGTGPEHRVWVSTLATQIGSISRLALQAGDTNSPLHRLPPQDDDIVDSTPERLHRTLWHGGPPPAEEVDPVSIGSWTGPDRGMANYLEKGEPVPIEEAAFLANLPEDVVNCQKTVGAYELLRRGYTEAIAGQGNGGTREADYLTESGERLNNLVTQSAAMFGEEGMLRYLRTRGMIKTSLSKFLYGQPVGSRGFLAIKYEYANGHIVNWERTANGVFVVDPQAHEIYPLTKYTKTFKSVQGVLRTDDLEVVEARVLTNEADSGKVPGILGLPLAPGLTAAYNPTQWRDPHSGRWIDMPWTVLRKFMASVERLDSAKRIYPATPRQISYPNHAWYVNNRKMFALQRKAMGNLDITFGDIQDFIDEAQQILKDQQQLVETLDVAYHGTHRDFPVPRDEGETYRTRLRNLLTKTYMDLDDLREKVGYKNAFDRLDDPVPTPEEVLQTLQRDAAQMVTKEFMEQKLIAAGVRDLPQVLRGKIAMKMAHVPEAFQRALEGKTAMAEGVIDDLWRLSTDVLYAPNPDGSPAPAEQRSDLYALILSYDKLLRDAVDPDSPLRRLQSGEIPTKNQQPSWIEGFWMLPKVEDEHPEEVGSWTGDNPGADLFLEKGPRTSIAEAMFLANLGGYRYNCQKAVGAYELLRRGYPDAVAGAGRGGGSNEPTILAESVHCDMASSMFGREGRLRAQESRTRGYDDPGAEVGFLIQAFIDEQPRGSRGFLSHSNGPDSNGHIVVWEKLPDANVVIIDPQSQEIYSVEEYATYVYKIWDLYRTDDLPVQYGRVLTDQTDDGQAAAIYGAEILGGDGVVKGNLREVPQPLRSRVVEVERVAADHDDHRQVWVPVLGLEDEDGPEGSHAEVARSEPGMGELTHRRNGERLVFREHVHSTTVPTRYRFNPDQLRVPRGTDRAGEWLDTPWKTVRDFLGEGREVRIPQDAPWNMNAAAWDAVLTDESRSLDNPQKAHPERYEPNRGYGKHLREGEIEERMQRPTDPPSPPMIEVKRAISTPEWLERQRMGDPSLRDTPLFPAEIVEERPPASLYRVMSDEEFMLSQEQGYLQSDQRMNLGDEGTVTSLWSTADFYVPVDGSPYRVVRLRYDPADEWVRDPRDGYVKTHAPIPFDRVEVYTQPLPSTREPRLIEALMAGAVAQARVPKGNPKGGQWLHTPWRKVGQFLLDYDVTPAEPAVPISKKPPAHLEPATPELLQKFKETYGKALPPNWTDVYLTLTPDPDSHMVARGTAANGKFQYVYTDRGTEESAADKFRRLNLVHATKEKLDSALTDVGQDGTLAAIRLMHLTGIRVGSSTKQQGKVMAYGAATLQLQHATKVDDGTVRLDFTAKEGLPATYDITDPELVRFISERLASGEAPESSLFQTTAVKTQKRVQEISGIPEMKNHDLRTWLANRVALREVNARGPARTEVEFRKMRNEIGKVVAEQLRNKPEQALASYINPVLFEALLPQKAEVGAAA